MGCCTGREGSTPGSATRLWTPSTPARRSTGSPRASTPAGWALTRNPSRRCGSWPRSRSIQGLVWGGRVRPLRRRVRHGAGDARLSRDVQGRSRALSGSHDARYFNLGFVEAYDGADNPEAWARASNVDIADRLAGKLLLIHGEMDDQVHPDHTLRLADRLIAADKDFELLIVPGAEHTFIDCLPYVRKRCWDFLVRELMGTQPPAYRPAPIAIDPELLGELFA
jgi:acetyl esterase/lipase